MTITDDGRSLTQEEGAAKGFSRMTADMLARQTSRVPAPTSSVVVPTKASGVVVETPPVADALVLTDCLRDHADVVSQLQRAGGYMWYSAENFNKAHRWCLGIIALLNAGRSAQFFVEAIVDLYHFDRALCASAHSRAGHEPVRRTDIPDTLPQHQNYHLVVQPFAWSPTVPHEAIDIVADFLQRITPDKLWIAEYKYIAALKIDPIIYATFGPWELELARWD